MSKSKQPFFWFSTDAEEQKEQLKTNELMMQYRAYRKQHRDEPFYPSYHFWAPDGKINDPNGLCYYNGFYHVFYQQYPPCYPYQHWGHAISTDMVHWRDLPSAIYPDIEEACYSGNTLVEEDRVIAMYHGRGIGNMIATSSDPLLLNWEKNPANPVLPHPPTAPDEKPPYRIFDPYLWREEDGYYALSGSHMDGAMKEYLFFSRDLTHWTYLGPLMDENPFVENPNDGACPYFLPFGKNPDGRILFFFSHSSGSRALVGTYNKVTHKFTPKSCMKFSYDSVGFSSLIAPCAIPDGNGGAYVIYNMGDSLMNIPRKGMFSLMRHVTEDDEGNVRILPAAQNEVLRQKEIWQGEVALTAFERVALPANGKCVEITASLHMGKARSVEFRVLCDKAGREYTTVSLTAGKNRGKLFLYLTVDTSHASLSPDVIGRMPDTTRFAWDGTSPISLRIFVDKCMVEVFAGEHAALCQLAYATLPDADGITVEAIGSDARLEDVHVFALGSIYEEE